MTAVKDYITQARHSLGPDAPVGSVGKYLSQSLNPSHDGKDIVWMANVAAQSGKFPWGLEESHKTPASLTLYDGTSHQVQENAGLATGEVQHFELTLEQKKNDSNVDLLELALDRATTQLGNDGIDLNPLTGLYAKQLADKKSAEYMDQRRNSLVLQRDAKRDAISAPTGALNFQGAMDGLLKRYTSDFGDAVARLTQVSKGLEDLYGYTAADHPLPPVIVRGAPEKSEVIIDAGRAGARFDDWIIWVRDAANWLIRFSQTGQQIVVPVSVRSKLNEDWSNFKSGAKTTLLLDPLPNAPDSLRNVRLRGISVYASFSSNADLPGPLQFIITVPSSSYSVYQDDPAARHHDIRFQDKVRPCYAGRVLPRSAPHPPDVLGADDLYNAGPYGRWAIQLLSHSDTVRNLEDVEIDLLLVVQILGG